jgi:hypothetical protein
MMMPKLYNLYGLIISLAIFIAMALFEANKK